MTALEPVLEVVTTPTEANLVRNADFEQVQGSRFAQWSPAPNGYGVAVGAGRSGSQALVCQIPSATGWYGASQTLTLQRAAPVPLVVNGWSRAEAVTGGADAGYSIYVDILYADGTPLWGQTGNFRTGTHDWERVEFTIYPEKPVRTLSLHLLVRGHGGTVWFDDVSVTELDPGAQGFLFQGVGMSAPSPLPPLAAPTEIYATGNGLQLGLDGTRVTRLSVWDRDVTGPLAGGFLARDILANSALRPFEAGACPELGLRLEATFHAGADHLAIQGTVRDTRGEDRAILLVFALPVDATGWFWDDDLEQRRTIEGTQEYAVTARVQAGTTGTLSTYPLASVSDGTSGLGLGLDLSVPALYRLVYHAGAKWLFIAYDFGLAPDTDHFPSAASFRLVVYPHSGRWGFRSALQGYREIFAHHFQVRSREQGIWMPFTDVSRVQGWQDFGFRYHEGNNNVAFDDANGILSFRYSEPMTWWMPMAPDVARTAAEALRLREAFASGSPAYHQKMALVSRAAGMFDAQGDPVLLFRNEPWNNGAVWSLNPNPRLPGTPNAATALWNDAVRAQWYGPDTAHHLDGEYLDSLEGYVTPDLNHRREHFRHTTVPLTFAPVTRALGLFKGLSVFEFTRWIGDDLHRLGRLTFANSVPYRFPYLCPWLDLMGTEVNWLTSDGYQPASLRQLALWRTLSGGKPYLLLMNTDFERFGPYVERYFQRCMLFALFPSMFSHNASEDPYWQNRRWYDRDRALFKKYIPVIRRLAEAGWQPIPRATLSNPAIRVERFGPDADDATYFALYNDTAQAQAGILHLERPTPAGQARGPVDLFGGETLVPAEGGWRVELAPHAALAVRAEPGPRIAQIEVTPERRVRLVVSHAPPGPGVLEQSLDLGAWAPVATNAGGTPEFTLEPAWSASLLGRFYRLRW